MREYQATKIVKGKEDRLRTAWWPCHAQSIQKYIPVGDAPSCTLATRARAEAFAGVEAWHRFAPGQKLMNEHVGLELALVEAGISLDTPRIARVGRLLFNNMKEQTRLYASRVADFPEGTFVDLFSEHIALLGEIVRLQIEKKAHELRECQDRCRKNTLALAVFTAEWF
jgi:hypothetical protein